MLKTRVVPQQQRTQERAAMRHPTKYLVAAGAVILCLSGAYVASEAATATITSKSGTVSAGSGNGGSSANVTSSSNVSNSVNSNTSSNVTSSNNSGSTSTIVSSDNTTSSCSTDVNGRRCEATCYSPQVAQCIKVNTTQPSCFCQ